MIVPNKQAGENPVEASVLEKVGVVVGQTAKTDRAQRIVAQCQQGDPLAFKQLFEQHVTGVYRHLRLLVGPGPEVDDLLQLVFLNVFQSIASFKGQSTFATWLFRVTSNVAHQEIRLKGRLKRLESAVGEAGKTKAPNSGETPEHNVAVQEQIYWVLDQLSWKKRETFILYAYEGYSLEEIAEFLDSSVSTVGSRLQSARKDIVRILGAKNRR